MKKCESGEKAWKKTKTSKKATSYLGEIPKALRGERAEALIEVRQLNKGCEEQKQLTERAHTILSDK